MLTPRAIGIAAALAVLAACSDTATEPLPFDPDLFAAGAGPSQGAPVVDRVVYDMSITVPCATFDMQIAVDGTNISQAWFYSDGVIRRYKLHVNQNATFTNLSSGLSATNNSNHNVEVLFDETGNPTTQVVNGTQQNIHGFDNQKILYYHIGHQVFDVDYSTSPPTIGMTFAGHSNLAGQAGPCVTLGDPV